MLPFHARLARIGLDAVEQYGFVLAGGYALSVQGIGNRPSNDIDLFTSSDDVGQFAQAGDTIIGAFQAAGLEVSINRRHPMFLDLKVFDRVTGERSDVQLGINPRSWPPARLAIGPVLDLKDAVGGKMSALYGRGEIRDYIDIYNVIVSGALTQEQVLNIADDLEANPLDRPMLADRFRRSNFGGDIDWILYGVDPAERAEIVQCFTDWADQIDPAPCLPSAPAAQFRVELPPPQPGLGI